MIEHLLSVSTALAAFLFMGTAYFGWGCLCNRLIGAQDNPDSPFLPVWMGWALTIFIFHCLNFFFPLTAATVFPVLFTGAAAAFPDVIRCVKKVFSQRYARLEAAGFLVFFLTAGSWLSSRAMLPPTFYDAGLYYFNTIRWINTFPAVPGLGNLHGRLAFNHSSLTYTASLNIGPFAGHGHSLANSFLLLLFLLTVLFPFYSAFIRKTHADSKHLCHFLPGLFMLPFTACLIFSTSLASPSADTVSVLLQLVLFLVFARGIASVRDGYSDQTCRTVFLICLSAAAVTVKLSNLAVCAVIAGIALIYAWISVPARRRCIAGATLLAVIWGSAWAVRGIILSGMPLYPSTVGRLPFDWAVPAAAADEMSNWIYSWARRPGVHFSEVLGNWGWLGHWFYKMIHTPGFILMATCPLLLSALFTFFSVCISGCRRLKKDEPFRAAEWLILLPPVAGILFWFFTAPDPRFSGGIFIQLLTGSSVLLLTHVGNRMSRMKIGTVIFLTANLLFFVFIAGKHDEIRAVSLSGWQPVGKVSLVEKITRSGLRIYTPETGDQCWDSPLPSTPWFNPELRLRVPGKLSSGFTVQKEN